MGRMSRIRFTCRRFSRYLRRWIHLIISVLSESPLFRSFVHSSTYLLLYFLRPPEEPTLANGPPFTPQFRRPLHLRNKTPLLLLSHPRPRTVRRRPVHQSKPQHDRRPEMGESERRY